MSRLPETHAAALRLRARGFDDDAIAKALALDPDAVPALLRIAETKLAALAAAPSKNRTTGRPNEATPRSWE
jgi:hypothetical protein